MDLLNLTAVELGKKIQAKETNAVEAVQAVLAQIDKMDDTIHSYVTVDKEGAMERAQKVQKQIEEGVISGPLAGVPVAIKDNMCTEGILTTCSSKILENF